MTDGGVNAHSTAVSDDSETAADEGDAESAGDADVVGFAPTTHRWGLEASPFVLGPILFTVGMALLLGLVPTALPFWDLAAAAVTEVFG